MKVKKFEIYRPVVEVEYNKLFGRLYLFFNYWRVVKLARIYLEGYNKKYYMLIVPKFRGVK